MIYKQLNIYITFIILIVFSFSVNAQIDSKKKNYKISGLDAPKDSLNIAPNILVKPITSGNLSRLNKPKSDYSLKMPKKEFSMFGEQFGNPGELYVDRVKKHENSIKKQEGLGTKGSKVDVFFGNHKTKSKTVRIMYRDYGLEDGDTVRVSVNDEVIYFRVGLINAFKGFKIELKEGVNTIEFLALNEGYAVPNTAHFRVVDEEDNIVASDFWSLSVNVKGTVNIIKE